MRWGMVGILALLVASAAFDAPWTVNSGIKWFNQTVGLALPTISEKPFQLGLDLKGGAQLIYQADMSSVAELDRSDALSGVRDVIERRVNAIGVGEPTVQTAKVGDDYRLNIELPGVTDVNDAIARIGETPILEFEEENNVPPRELTAEEKKQIVDENKIALAAANDILKRVKNGDDFVTVAQETSDDSSTKNNGGYVGFIGSNTNANAIYEWASKHSPGEIATTVLESDQAYHVVKRGEEKPGEPQVTASHILVCYLGSKSCENPLYTKDEARQKAQELFDEATADNFAQLAKENSTEPGASETGGDLGSFGRGAMTLAFENAVFDADIGSIIGPVETEFGFHVVYKRAEETSQTYEIFHIVKRKTVSADILPEQSPWKPTGLSGKQLDRALVVSDPRTGAVQVSLQFDSEGADLFADITGRNIGKQIAIFLDGDAISAPVVQTVITGGQAVISGTFTLAEAKELAQRLNTGALPVPIELVSQQTVGASLGAESLKKSLTAGIAGFILIMIFMILYYRLPGLLSVIALSLYVSLSLAILKLIGVTLSLAGIAGFILSIGMAVDANVLIFERLKEELREGKSLKAAVEEGFTRAWSSIRDGNFSTLITCAFLMWFGSSFVKGFAVTLTVGILVSMFSAITITRLMLRFIVPWFPRFANAMFLGAGADISKTE